MIVIGIDPGLTGAVAIIENRGATKIYDTPTAKIGSKSVFVLPQMVEILSGLENPIAAIELVHSMSKQGVTSSFNFGKGVGMWLGILAALQIPLDEVTPQHWQAAMLYGMQKNKDASRMRAMQLFPQLSEQLKLKSHHGRADALLIAEWRRRQG